MKVDVLSLFNSSHSGSKTDISHAHLLRPKSSLRVFVYSFYLAPQLYCEEGLQFLWLYSQHGMPLCHLLLEESADLRQVEEFSPRKKTHCSFVESASHRMDILAFF